MCSAPFTGTGTWLSPLNQPYPRPSTSYMHSFVRAHTKPHAINSECKVQRGKDKLYVALFWRLPAKPLLSNSDIRRKKISMHFYEENWNYSHDLTSVMKTAAARLNVIKKEQKWSVAVLSDHCDDVKFCKRTFKNVVITCVSYTVDWFTCCQGQWIS